jgi:hypothetical protein
MTGPVRTFEIKGFVEVRQLAALFAVNPATIRRRVHAHGGALRSHPQDRRVRLIADEDARLVFGLTPVPRRSRDACPSEG